LGGVHSIGSAARRPRHPQQPHREVRRRTRTGTLATSVGEDRTTP